MAKGTALPDPDELQQSAADPTTSVWVQASAGSGKTKVLTDRVLALLVNGAKPDSLLCVTYTKAAASEMANRIHKELAKWTQLSDIELDEAIEKLDGHAPTPEQRQTARQLFAKVLDVPGGLSIRTIHSFCQSILGRFPLEARVPPTFDAMDDREAADALRLARDTVLLAAQEGTTLAQSLKIVTEQVDEEQFARLLSGLTHQRRELRDALKVFQDVDGAVQRLYKILGADSGLDDETLIIQACHGADDLNLRAIADGMLSVGSKTDQTKAKKILAWLALGTEGRAATFWDYVGAFLTGKYEIFAKLCNKDTKTHFPDAEAVLLREAERLLAVDLHYRKQVTARSSEALLRLGAAMLHAYEARKQATARLDYDDLIQKTADLLRNDRVPWVLYKLDGRLDHLLIDEAQDTSPDQRGIVDALVTAFFTEGAEHPRTVFVVGDVKQSIYSFQGADPEGYQNWRENLDRLARQSGQAVRPVQMQVSFRSTQAVLDAVDATFNQDVARDGVVTDDRLEHFAFAKNAAFQGRVTLWPASEPPEKVESDLFLPPEEVKEKAEADATQTLAEGLARQVHQWISDKTILPMKGRPIRAGDILFLVRSRSPFIDALSRELTRLGVPVAGADRIMLTDQIAVMDLIALGRALLLPQDDLTFACLLKSPFLGFDEDMLFTLARKRERGVSLWQRLQHLSASEQKYAAAAQWFGELLAATDRLPPYELFQQALLQPCPGPRQGDDPSRTDGAALAERYTGRQALIARLGAEVEDPIEEFLNQALDYDRRMIPSLEGFLAQVSKDKTDVKRDPEAQARDEVRIMTAHGAKGLQAPIVILPDAMKKSDGGKEALRWCTLNEQGSLPLWTPKSRYLEPVANGLKSALKAKEDQEYRRLLYVAMTRAEAWLFITARRPLNSPPQGNWYDLVSQGFEALAQSNPGSVTEHEMDIHPNWTGVARIFETGTQHADTDQIQEDKDADGLSDGVPAWLDRGPAEEPMPPRPLVPSRPSQPDPPSRSPLMAADDLRFKRGKLIHRLLQTLPNLPDQDRDGAAERYLAQTALDLTEDQQAIIAHEALAVLRHPQFALLFGPGSRAEVPLAGLIQTKEGLLPVSGQVDRLLITENEILVADYKTLRPAPEDPAQVPTAYLQQMAGYRAILQQIFPDRAIRCALIFTETSRLASLSDDLLDRHA